MRRHLPRRPLTPTGYVSSCALLRLRRHRPPVPKRPTAWTRTPADGIVDNGTDGYDDDGDGYTEDGGDCDDTVTTADPAEVETCDGVDDDCDGVIDEGTDGFDDDGDGRRGRRRLQRRRRRDCPPGGGRRQRSTTTVTASSTTPSDPDGDGYTADGGDCDEGNASAHPGADEADGVDNDCDGLVDEGTAGYDDDGDGHTALGGDCDDADSDAHRRAGRCRRRLRRPGGRGQHRHRRRRRRTLRGCRRL